MSLGAKIILTIVAGLALFAVGVIGLGAYFWSRHGHELFAATERQYDQGLAFGRQTDESGCLDAAVTRYKGSPGLFGSIPASVFVKACWRTSRPTAGFCDQVPGPLDFLRGTRWQIEQSRKAGIDDQFGGQIFGQQRVYCDARVRSPALSR